MISNDQLASTQTSYDYLLESIDIVTPYSAYYKALARFKAAEDAINAATSAGDIDSRERAILDREEALADIQKVEHHEAERFAFGLRCLAKCYQDHPAANIPDRLANLEALAAQNAEASQ